MDGNYTAHAANERTFLAWLRTGIAVVAFGFVIEKFNLFISAIGTAAGEAGKAIHVERLAGPFGHYEGFAFMMTGIILILVGYVRFMRDARAIDQPGSSVRRGIKAELVITLILVLLAASYCIAILIR